VSADVPSLRIPRQAAIQNRESKIQNRLAVLTVATAVLVAGCGLTRSSKTTSPQSKPAASSKADGKNRDGTSKSDTIPNAAAVGLGSRD
jgi:hypothetical protein